MCVYICMCVCMYNVSIVCCVKNIAGPLSYWARKRAPHWGVQSRFRVIYISVCMYVCRYIFDCLWENNTKKLYAKMRGQNYVVQKRACSKSSFGILKRSAD